MEFHAHIAVHNGHHNKTPKEQFGIVEKSSSWENRDLTPQDLAEWIRSGKAWVGCHLAGGQRDEDHVIASNLIVLDIDGDLTLDAFWAIPTVQRHCLFTATSFSHTDQDHRFRALFACERHEEVDLHTAIYDLWIERLGLQLKDNCGNKPERLWYGNERAELRFGGGEPIPWDLIEQARDNLKAAQAARPRIPSQENPDDLALDLQRAVFCFEQLLRPSVDGDFSGGYWKELLLAAAATGDENVQQAFLQWHNRGHHSKTQHQVRRRLQHSRSRMTPGEGAGKILKLTKEQHGEQWWKLLPKELHYRSSENSYRQPTVLARSRSEGDITPFSIIWSPDIAPTKNEPEEVAGGAVMPSLSLAHSSNARDTTESSTESAPDLISSTAEQDEPSSTAQYTPLMASRGPETPILAPPTTPEEPLNLKQRLHRLYQLRAYGVLKLGDDLKAVSENDRAFCDRELLGEVLTQPGYCNQSSEVERDLLTIFRGEQGLRDNSYRKVRGVKITGTNHKRAQWLIPGFLVVGGEHVLYAQAGVGKTTLALHMARAVTGDPAITSFLDSGPLNNHHAWRRNPVLFIGTDMYASAQEMTVAYLEDFGLLGLEFLEQVEWWFEQNDSPAWVLCLKDLVRLYEFLESNFLAGTPVTAVFIDSMKAVCPDHLLVGQQGFKDYIKLIKTICKQFNAALVWIHHSRADGTGAQGITRITEGSDANFHLKRDDKTRQISLDVEKIRGGGKARTLFVDLFHGTPRALPTPDTISNEGSNTSSREQLILAVMEEHFRKHRIANAASSERYIETTYLGMKSGEIEKAVRTRLGSRALGSSPATLKRTIKSLKDAGRIKGCGVGRYRLPPRSELDRMEQPGLLAKEAPRNVPGW